MTTPNPANKITYQVVNRKTNQVVGTYSTATRARTARDTKDNAYGAYIHEIRAVSPDPRFNDKFILHVEPQPLL